MEHHLCHGQLHHISTNFPISIMIYMEKLISDRQHNKNVYPMLEMLNIKIKCLKMQKCKFENLIKNPKMSICILEHKMCNISLFLHLRVLTTLPQCEFVPSNVKNRPYFLHHTAMIWIYLCQQNLQLWDEMIMIWFKGPGKLHFG